MHCGVMVTGYNQGDWERLLAEDYSRPPAVSDAANMDDTLELGELVEPLGFDSIWAARHKGQLTTRIKAAFTTEASARMAAENGLGQMFVAGAGLDEMTAQVRRFNTIRAGMGLPPDQPTTLLWMYCA